MVSHVDSVAVEEPLAVEPGEQRRYHPLLLWAWSLLRLDFVGVAFGALFFCLFAHPVAAAPRLAVSRADRRRQRRHRLRHRCRDRQDIPPHGAALAQLVAAEPAGAVPRQGREPWGCRRRPAH